MNQSLGTPQAIRVSDLARQLDVSAPLLRREALAGRLAGYRVVVVGKKAVRLIPLDDEPTPAAAT